MLFPILSRLKMKGLIRFPLNHLADFFNIHLCLHKTINRFEKFVSFKKI
jgi:hypothetical protein